MFNRMGKKVPSQPFEHPDQHDPNFQHNPVLKKKGPKEAQAKDPLKTGPLKPQEGIPTFDEPDCAPELKESQDR